VEPVGSSKRSANSAISPSGLAERIVTPESPSNQTSSAVRYALEDLPFSLRSLRPHVMRYRRLYNHVRPHQALGDLTPAEYLRGNHPDWSIVASKGLSERRLGLHFES